MVPEDLPKLRPAAAAAEGYRELEEARAFNTWLGERRQEGRRHLDDVSRLTEAVHRQLRYARAERRGIEQTAEEVAQ